MADRITLDSGLKSIEVYFKDRDETAEISFNPTDPNLAVRFDKLQNRVDAKLKDLTSDIELNPDGTAKDMGFVKNVEAIDTALKEELDFAFGNKISDVVFSHCNPMASVDGEYFIIQFIKRIMPYVKKSIQNESKALTKHLEKYRR